LDIEKDLALSLISLYNGGAKGWVMLANYLINKKTGSIQYIKSLLQMINWQKVRAQNQTSMEKS